MWWWDAGQALGAMAAYIDLNPVRAGMVEDPKDYRWSGYGAAMAGQRRAKEGLRKVVAGLQQGVESLSGALAVYRMHPYLEGEQVYSYGRLQSVTRRDSGGGQVTTKTTYAYDAQGRMTNMVTWQFNLLTGAGSTSATTTWQYETNRGGLRLKGYPNARIERDAPFTSPFPVHFPVRWGPCGICRWMWLGDGGGRGVWDQPESRYTL